MLHRKIVFLFILTIVTSLTPLFAQRVVGYLPYYRGYNASFDYTKYTHIHYFAIWPETDGNFIYPGSMDSLSMATQFHQVAAKSGDAKMVMTFGGTSENGSKHFIEMASNATARTNFIQNVKELCEAWNIDGVDIDWEWSQHTNTAETSLAFTSLMTDLRTMVDETELSFSIDVSPSSYNGKYSNPEAIKLADYVNVMSYQYSGSWAKTTGHHSPMNKVTAVGLKYWEDQGIPAEKLNLGSAFYGFSYSGTSSVGESFTGMETLTYPQVKALIDNGYTVVEDDLLGTYCYSNSDNKIVFYDSPRNVNYKMEYATDNNYSGIVLWEIGQDNITQDLATSIYEVKEEVTTAANEQSIEHDYTVYQVNTSLHIELPNEGTLLSLYSLSGDLISTSTTNSKLVTFDVNTLNQGIYILHIQNNTTFLSKKIFIK